MTQVNKKLEEYRWFPYVAWTLSIGFSIFVGFLAIELRNTAASIEQSSLNLEQRIKAVEAMLAE